MFVVLWYVVCGGETTARRYLDGCVVERWLVSCGGVEGEGERNLWGEWGHFDMVRG